MPLGNWKLALLLLLVAGGLPGISDADSPKWADGDLLVVWPEALGDTLPPAGDVKAVTAAAGHATLSDEHDDGRDHKRHQPVASAEWWESSSSKNVKAAAGIEPAGIETVVPVHRPSTACRHRDGWQVLPAGMLYKSYLAGEKEPRMAAALLNERNRGSVLETTIGGRLGLLRHGTAGPINPEGFQWDLEGAALLRQDPEQELDVEATDFRIGSVLTWRVGPTAVKAGYYHLSSHVGDEFLLRNPTFPRLNYVRDSVLVGVHHHLRDDLSIYGEVAYAFKTDGGAEPLELQFGFEYTPIDTTNRVGAPVLAVNGHLREEFRFGGSVNIIAGWEWRGPDSDRRLRIGGQYYNGKEIQWSFFNESVAFTGIGIWYDF